jgi:hypothetical protein
MSEDTHRLAEKQQLLMGNINKLQPMMEKAGSLLEGLNMEKMTNMLDGLGSKLTSLTGTGAGAGSDMNAMGPVGASDKKNTKKAQ